MNKFDKTLEENLSKINVQTMRFWFEVEAGFLIRKDVRIQLENSKKKLKYWYPECQVLLIEDKSLFESKFYFEAKNLPASEEENMRTWVNQMKNFNN